MGRVTESDVVIIGGGPAGLSAALYAGRARLRVVVVDRGAPRHAVSPAVHNFLTREGTSPAELRRIAWEQLAAFPGVSKVHASVASLRREGDQWVADCGEAGQVRGRAALLAVGVRDELPDWPGFRERWGHSIHFCPFCHGWEMRDLPLATFGHGEAIAHFGPMLAQWSRDIVVISGEEALSPDTEAALEGHGIRVHRSTIVALEGEGTALSTILLADGTRLARAGLFLMAAQRQLPLVRSLQLETSPLPGNPDGLVVVDEHHRTSAPWLWAAGDLTTHRQQVLEAAAAGGRAGAGIVASFALGGL